MCSGGVPDSTRACTWSAIHSRSSATVGSSAARTTAPSGSGGRSLGHLRVLGTQVGRDAVGGLEDGRA